VDVDHNVVSIGGRDSADLGGVPKRCRGTIPPVPNPTLTAPDLILIQHDRVGEERDDGITITSGGDFEVPTDDVGCSAEHGDPLTP
jgi:hypothetical protein